VIMNDFELKKKKLICVGFWGSGARCGSLQRAKKLRRGLGGGVFFTIFQFFCNFST